MKTPEEIEKLALNILTKEYEKFGKDNNVNVGVPKIHIDKWVNGYSQCQENFKNRQVDVTTILSVCKFGDLTIKEANKLINEAFTK